MELGRTKCRHPIDIVKGESVHLGERAHGEASVVLLLTAEMVTRKKSDG